MVAVADLLSSLIEGFLEYVVIPFYCICGFFAMIFYIIRKPLTLLPNRGKQIVHFICKWCAQGLLLIAALPIGKTILTIGSYYAVVGLLYALGAKNVTIFLVILAPILAYALTAFGVFLVSLAVKGLSVALGHVLSMIGDNLAYVNIVRKVGGKFIVFKGEDASQYPPDMVIYSDETRAEHDQRIALEREIARQRNQEQARKKAFAAAEKSYKAASTRYANYCKAGLMENAYWAKREMDAAAAEMLKYK